MVARVVKSTGSNYFCHSDSIGLFSARLRGQLRLDGSSSTNPVSVGDWVEIEKSDQDYLISGLIERKNYIIRKSVNLSHRQHVIAANVDQLIVLASPADPRTPAGFIDRVLVTAEAYHIPGIILLNKCDLLLDEKSTRYAEELEKTYISSGYPFYRISLLAKTGLDPLSNLFLGKTSVIMGQSGSGKSSLIKHFAPGLNIRLGEISAYNSKGKHTTTFAEMHRIKKNTWIIDTPGIKEFGLVNFEKAELARYFPEMVELLPGCKYYNCTHVNEPGCAVLHALEHEKVSMSRYTSYLKMLEEYA